jgi:hypothetical protein
MRADGLPFPDVPSGKPLSVVTIDISVGWMAQSSGGLKTCCYNA